MIEYIFVMLIWIGGGKYSGPTTIQGFSSLEICKQAIEILKTEDNSVWSYTRYFKCVKLPK